MIITRFFLTLFWHFLHVPNISLILANGWLYEHHYTNCLITLWVLVGVGERRLYTLTWRVAKSVSHASLIYTYTKYFQKSSHLKKVFLPSLDATLSLLTLLIAYWPWTLTQKSFCLLLMLLFLCLLSSQLIDRGSFSWCYSFSVYSPRRLLTVDPYTKVFLPSLDATLSLLTHFAAYWSWILLLMQLFLCLLSWPLTDVDPSLDATLSLFTFLAAYWPWTLTQKSFCLLLMLFFLCLLSSPLIDRGFFSWCLLLLSLLSSRLTDGGSFSWCYSFSAYFPRRLRTVDYYLDATLSLFTRLAAYWPWTLTQKPFCLPLMLLFLCLLCLPLTDRGHLHKSLFAFSWCYSFSAYSPPCWLTVNPSLDATLSLFTLLAAYWPWTLTQKSFCLLLMLLVICLFSSSLTDRGIFIQKPFCLLLMLLFLCLLCSPLTDRGYFSWCYPFSVYSPPRLLTVDPYTKGFCLLLMLFFLCLLSSPLTDRGFFSRCYSFSAYSPRRLLTVDSSLDATLSLLTLLAAYWP